MLICRISGGLGNQMFEYAYARRLAAYYKDILVFDLSDFASDAQRKFTLSHCNIPEIRCLNNLDGLGTVVDVKPYKLTYRELYKISRYTVPSNVKILLASLSGNIYHLWLKYRRCDKRISDYYQSEYFFMPIREQIKRELKVKTPPSPENQAILKRIETVESVCVHIRLGDYLLPQWKSLQVCTRDYYINAMRYIQEHTKNPKFFVFSNTSSDVEHIRKTYGLPYNVEYVTLDNPDYEELRLMYSCEHFVIANSSFSWWAQYLCDNVDKIVVAPNEWVKGGGKKDVYDEKWIRMMTN